MPENGESTELTFNASSLNSTDLASAKVGDGPSGPVANSLGQFPIHSCCGRLFHKVSGGKTTCEYQSNNSSEILLPEHILQVRGPRELTVDNGKQFDCYTFKEYCKTLGTQAKFSSVYHPQSNGAVDRANGLIFSGIKKCLFDQKKGKWVDELPKVIWSYNTTVSRATGFTPFRLLFGTKAMTPEEIKNESMRVLKGKEIEEINNKVEKDMIELTILEAAENIEKYQRETRAWRDKKVVRKDIKTGDLVLKRKKNRENPGKLHESWEGPFIARETDMPGAFRLIEQTGEELPYS
jgi:hypothetical protein